MYHKLRDKYAIIWGGGVILLLRKEKLDMGNLKSSNLTYGLVVNVNILSDLKSISNYEAEQAHRSYVNRPCLIVLADARAVFLFMPWRLETTHYYYFLCYYLYTTKSAITSYIYRVIILWFRVL